MSNKLNEKTGRLNPLRLDSSESSVRATKYALVETTRAVSDARDAIEWSLHYLHVRTKNALYGA